MRCPAGVCSSQSTVAEASSTIIVQYVPRARVRWCRERGEAVCACADAHEIRPASDVPRSLAAHRANSPRATCPPSRPWLSGCDEEHPGHCEPGSFSPCYEHSCMCCTCQCTAREDKGEDKDRGRDA